MLLFRNLLAHPTRTLLTALAVGLGVAMLTAADVAGAGFRQGFASDESRRAFQFMFDAFENSLSAVGMVILLATAFLIFNTVTMTVAQRQRQIGVLRSLGMTRAQALGLVLGEALATGGLGALLGLALGPPLGQGLLSLVGGAGLPAGPGALSAGGLALAAALGMGLTLLSALAPAWSAARLSPLAAVRAAAPSAAEASPARQAWAGLAGLAGIMLCLLAAPPGRWAEPPLNFQLAIGLSLAWVAAGSALIPAAVGWAGRGARAPLARLFHAPGLLAADNFQRDRRRVTLTILTCVAGLTVMVSLTGIFTFSLEVLFQRWAGEGQRARWIVNPDLDGQDPTLETLAVPNAVMDELRALVAGRAEVGGYYYVFIPEISALVANFPSLMADPQFLVGEGGFKLVDGDWAAARPAMENGCAFLLLPDVAARNRVQVGGTLRVQGQDGPVDCLVAGLGSGGAFYPTSFVGLGARDLFRVGSAPGFAQVAAMPGADVAALERDLQAFAGAHAGSVLSIQPVSQALNEVMKTNRMLLGLLDALLLLAVAASALGVVNTLTLSISERRKELGLLRAAGLARAQVAGLVIGEAALMGAVGGVFGLALGAGVSLVFAVSYGGRGYGLPDLPLWPAAWQATRPALAAGVWGLIAAPVISAGAALVPARWALRGQVVAALDSER